MILAVDWTAVGIVGTLVVSLMGSLFGLYQARKADRSATTTKTIELGVKDLIDQYQERQQELKTDVEECNKKCAAVEAELNEVRAKLRQAETHIDNLEAEIIRLRRETGELP